METLDRLGWAAGIAFRAQGARLGVRVSHPAILQRLPDSFPPGWKPSSSPLVDTLYSLIVGDDSGTARKPSTAIRRFHLLYGGRERLARATGMDEVLRSLQSSMDWVVAHRARHRLFVRAGVVSWLGQAIIVVGAPGAGKTTIVSALLEAGAIPCSDTYAVIDRSGRIHPYRRNPVRSGNEIETPMPAGMILITEYRRDSAWHLRLLSPAQGMLALMQYAILTSINPGIALKTLHRAVMPAVILQGLRGEADGVIAVIEKELEGAVSARRHHAPTRS